MEAENLLQRAQVVVNNSEPTPQTNSSLGNWQHMCMQPIGIAVVATVFFVILLVILRPSFVTKEDEVSVNYVVVLLIAVMGGCVVLFVGKSATK